ncbi:c6 zinc finger domain-containing protein [Colletotrichum incanum]|uniref:C6 zinc finger domain-containing protein n=1 Tax=Colletotrichum incanum TaxID=1573173 RepID=A0A167CKF1_COLIC|nr:c6 zinc finger domain-containing protein [Colletotrichum incanum]
MHGILSLTALHLAHLDLGDKRSHMRDASHRHNQALQGFRTAIENITDGNSDALFACTSVNIVYVFGMYGHLYGCHDGGDSPSARIERVLGAEWIPMIRGVEAVLSSVHDRVRSGPLSPLLDLRNWDELDPDSMSLVGDEQFQGIRAIWTASTDCGLYDQSLYLLRKCYAYMQQFGTLQEAAAGDGPYNRTWSGPLMWLHFVPEEFVIRLRQRQPPALVLFSHLGILFHALEELWIFKGWARSIVEAVDEVLGAYWESWIKWPKKVVGLSCCTK